MKKIVIIVMLFAVLTNACSNKSKIEENLNVTIDTETLNQEDKDFSYINDSFKEQINESIPQELLETWSINVNNIDEKTLFKFQYMNSSDEKYSSTDSLSISENAYQLSSEEKSVVGYWFGLDKLSQDINSTNLLEVLKESVHPSIVLYPNKLFIIQFVDNGPIYFHRIGWTSSAPVFIHDGPKKEALIEGFCGLYIRGTWSIENNKLFLNFYQYLIVMGHHDLEFSLSSPY